MKFKSKFALFWWSCVSRWYSSWSLAPYFRRPNCALILIIEAGWFFWLVDEWNVARLGSMCRVLPPVMWQDSSGSNSWWCQAWRLSHSRFIWNESNVWSELKCHFMSFRFLEKYGMVVGKSLAGYRDSDLPKATGVHANYQPPKWSSAMSDIQWPPKNSRCWIVTFQPLQLSVGLASVHWRLWQISWVPLVPRKENMLFSTAINGKLSFLSSPYFALGSGTGILLVEVLHCLKRNQ